MLNQSKCRITITKNGPYLVSGNVPIEERIITSGEAGNEYINGRRYPQMENYALCRCGQSKRLVIARPVGDMG